MSNLRTLANDAGRNKVIKIPKIKKKEGLIAADGNELYGLKGDKKYPIAEMRGGFQALCAHNGTLYYVGSGNTIFDALNDAKVTTRNFSVYALCSHDGILYDTGGDNSIYDTFKNKIIAKRDNTISTLLSYKGNLYSGGDDSQVYSISEDKVIAQREYYVLALGIHNGTLYDGNSMGIIYDTLKNKEIVMRGASVNSLYSHNGVLYDSGKYGTYNTLGKSRKKYALGFKSIISVDMKLWKALVEKGESVK